VQTITSKDPRNVTRSLPFDVWNTAPVVSNAIQFARDSLIPNPGFSLTVGRSFHEIDQISLLDGSSFTPPGVRVDDNHVFIDCDVRMYGMGSNSQVNTVTAILAMLRQRLVKDIRKAETYSFDPAYKSIQMPVVGELITILDSYFSTYKQLMMYMLRNTMCQPYPTLLTPSDQRAIGFPHYFLYVVGRDIPFWQLTIDDTAEFHEMGTYQRRILLFAQACIRLLGIDDTYTPIVFDYLEAIAADPSINDENEFLEKLVRPLNRLGSGDVNNLNAADWERHQLFRIATMMHLFCMFKLVHPGLSGPRGLRGRITLKARLKTSSASMPFEPELLTNGGWHHTEGTHRYTGLPLVSYDFPDANADPDSGTAKVAPWHPTIFTNLPQEGRQKTLALYPRPGVPLRIPTPSSVNYHYPGIMETVPTSIERISYFFIESMDSMWVTTTQPMADMAETKQLHMFARPASNTGCFEVQRTNGVSLGTQLLYGDKPLYQGAWWPDVWLTAVQGTVPAPEESTDGLTVSADTSWVVTRGDVTGVQAVSHRMFVDYVQFNPETAFNLPNPCYSSLNILYTQSGEYGITDPLATIALGGQEALPHSGKWNEDRFDIGLIPNIERVIGSMATLIPKSILRELSQIVATNPRQTHVEQGDVE
jgi:hypothetical protein